MKPDTIIQKLRKIKGVEQAEFCPLKEKQCIAFIVRMKKDHRFGIALHAYARGNDVHITERSVASFIKNIKNIING